MLFSKDTFGHLNIIKAFLVGALGFVTYLSLRILNRFSISGMEHLKALEKTNVLFVSNHQTYFMDVVSMYHAFSKLKWEKSIGPTYLFAPKLNNYYISAEETMKAGIIPKLMAYVGSVSVRRTWRDKDQSVKRQVRFADITNIGIALDDGWVITFPQGTTQPNAPGRRGVVYIIKKFKPVVVPVVVNGFAETFSKKSLVCRKTGSRLHLTFKEPLTLDPNDDPDAMLEKIMIAIEQPPTIGRDR